MSETGWNGWNWLNMPGNDLKLDQNGWTWPEMAGNGRELTRMARNGLE